MKPLIQKTIGQQLKDTAQKFAEREAMVYSKEGIRYTYEEFYGETGRIAKALLAMGIKKGEHIAIWATNIPEWPLLQFASARIGAVLVTVNTSYQKSELQYLLQQSDVTSLFLIEGYKGTSYTKIVQDILKESKGELPELKNIIYIGSSNTPDGMTAWQELLIGASYISDEELLEREKALDQHETINMQYTSGTTGFPKGVMLSHHNIINNAYLVAQAMNLSSEDRLVIPVPFFHCFGCVMGSLACITAGACMLPITEFHPRSVLETIHKEKGTALHGVPTMYIAELMDEQFDSYDLSSLKRGIMSGSPCPSEIMKKVMNRMGMQEITIAYGQTEASPVITQTRIHDSLERRVGTVGKAQPHAEVKIIDPLTGEESAPNEQGELCTRGFLVMKGYYKMPEATHQAIDSEGWLHTGDLASMDEDGYITITGRLKDMIIRGGENVYPREIEEFLYSHEDIVDVQVIGVPDEKYGERVAACIKIKEGKEITEENIREYCKGRIAFHKIPDYCFIMEEYPMTASGKIQKYKLRQQAKEWAAEKTAAK
ncbi:AMP-binding protein [Metabacillus sp. GX 13764]|uniref:AMP-binding protein n=1 Tax=Metabacillus kandeliae TaxID=2900151 RepID=UPI001E4A1F2B|nr:AMP-binding protein [Metabacillus kandeliae]MCD7035858.1 AMP-binding protein [Metabacillus kandeliae]